MFFKVKIFAFPKLDKGKAEFYLHGCKFSVKNTAGFYGHPAQAGIHNILLIMSKSGEEKKHIQTPDDDFFRNNYLNISIMLIIPFLIIITAIAAKKRLVILLKTLVPMFPIILITKSERKKIIPVKIILIITEINVGAKPYCSRTIRLVVNTAGPAIKGVPNGTKANSGFGLIPFFSGSIMLIIDMQNNIAPPAIIKSFTVIPMKLKINFPRKIKPIDKNEAVIIVLKIIFNLSFLSRSIVKKIYIGNAPIASIATKTGMNDRRMFFSI